MANDKKPDRPPRESKEPEKETVKEKSADVGKQAQETVKKVYDYACNMQNDTLAYIVVAVGLVLFFFVSSMLGGAVIGVIFGIQFADQIATGIQGAKSYFQKEQLARTLIVLSVVLVLLFASPAFFLGAAAGVGVVPLLGCDKSKK